MRRPTCGKLALTARLREVVEEKLEERWSPQQIAGWLGCTYPDDLAMRVSHETIYLSLFVRSRGRCGASYARICAAVGARAARGSAGPAGARAGAGDGDDQ